MKFPGLCLWLLVAFVPDAKGSSKGNPSKTPNAEYVAKPKLPAYIPKKVQAAQQAPARSGPTTDEKTKASHKKEAENKVSIQLSLYRSRKLSLKQFADFLTAREVKSHTLEPDPLALYTLSYPQSWVKLQKGAYAVVYRASVLDTMSGRTRDFAIKVFNQFSDKKAQENTRAIFEREDALLKYGTASGCSSMVRYETSSLSLNIIKESFIVMEFVDGMDLYDYARHIHSVNQEAIPIEMLRLLAARLVVAVQDAHSKNLFIGDLKPDNIMLNSKGSVKLIDFGFARIHYDRSDCIQVKSIGTFGTALYSSPEACRGEPFGPEYDIWALGDILHFVAHLSLPFSKSTDAAEVVQKDLSELNTDAVREALVKSHNTLAMSYRPALKKRLGEASTEEERAAIHLEAKGQLEEVGKFKDLLGSLFEIDPAKRLELFKSIRGASFFARMDWSTLQSPKR